MSQRKRESWAPGPDIGDIIVAVLIFAVGLLIGFVGGMLIA